MANRKNRQETVADKYGTTFKVGDGVHWGFNGDRRPGTVLFVSDSGRQVFVSNDDYQITDDLGGYVEGDRKCDFTTIPCDITECRVWTLRKDGRFTDSAGRHGRTLNPGRAYAQNPCI